MAKYQDTPEYKAATEAQRRDRDALVEEIRQHAAGKRRAAKGRNTRGSAPEIGAKIAGREGASAM
jgi:hypothetical protein